MKRFLKWFFSIALVLGLGGWAYLTVTFAPELEGAVSQHTAPLVIFDFDGTIIDSFEESLKIINTYSGQYDFKPFAREEYPEIRSSHMREILKKRDIGILKRFAIVRGFRITMEEQGGARLRPVEGMKNVMQTLKKKGARIGIATSNSGKVVKEFLAHNNFPKFDFIYSRGALLGKAKLLTKIKKKAKNATAIYYVGDEMRDIKAAKEAGVRSVSVTWGFNDKHCLATGKPDALVDHPGEIVEAIG